MPSPLSHHLFLAFTAGIGIILIFHILLVIIPRILEEKQFLMLSSKLLASPGHFFTFQRKYLSLSIKSFAFFNEPLALPSKLFTLSC